MTVERSLFCGYCQGISNEYPHKKYPQHVCIRNIDVNFILIGSNTCFTKVYDFSGSD